MYDTRPAKTIAKARKFHYRRPLSKRDEALLRLHASTMAVNHPDAMLVRFHRRRRLTEWEYPIHFGFERQTLRGFDPIRHRIENRGIGQL